MILRARDIPTVNGRRPYPLDGREILAKHFVVRETTPTNPFGPHKHEQPELWFIISGEAVVKLGDQETTVEPGDLIVIDPWEEHGLSASSRATWICLG
ncbi:MAG: cupin domain-containing protein [Chloroflexi bacterium]|nr:cupin domain-containing protein [Chloroflexota bacterium]